MSARRVVLKLEELETRSVPASFSVSSLGDGEDTNPGDGIAVDAGGFTTLRAAMMEAEALAGADTITFHHLPPGIHTIVVGKALPTITAKGGSITIDGTTLPGYDPTHLPGVMISGPLVPAPGLTIESGNSTIKGLGILGFSGAGILLRENGSNEIFNNLIGIDRTSATGNNGNDHGIEIVDSSDNVIGSKNLSDYNVISGNTQHGIHIRGNSSGNIVVNNLIGTDLAGTSLKSNSQGGIFIGEGATKNQVGQAWQWQNVIASGRGHGIHIAGNENVVAGNNIGLNRLMSDRLGNDIGVLITGNGNTIGGEAKVTFGSKGNPTYISEPVNIISGNDIGIRILGKDNHVNGNFVGLGPNGEAQTVFGNAEHGIQIGGPDPVAATNNNIGGKIDPVTGKIVNGGHVYSNVISNNRQGGIYFVGPGPQANTVQENRIGLNREGTSVVGNESFDNAKNKNVGFGIKIENSALNVVGNGNSIATNKTFGIYIVGVGSAENTVNGNFIENSDIAVFVEGAGKKNDISYNHASQTRDGIHVINSEGTIINGNEIPSASEVGVRLQGLTPNTLASANLLSGSNLAGIVVDYLGVAASGIVISNNKVYDNVGSGIIVQSAVGIVITQNEIYSNQAYGLFLSQSTDAQLAANVIGKDALGTPGFGNALDGIFIADSTNVSSTNDQIYDNLGAGIRSTNSTNVTFQNTVALNNQLIDLVFESGSGLVSGGTHLGDLRVAGGALTLQNSVLIDDLLQIDGGTVNVNGGSTVTIATGDLVQNGGTFVSTGSSLAVGDDLTQNGGAFEVHGGSLNLSGDYLLAAGTALIDAASFSGATGLNAGGRLTFVNNASASFSAPFINGAAGILELASATWTGTLRNFGLIYLGTQSQIASGNIIALYGNFEQFGGGRIFFDIDASGADKLIVSGLASLAGHAEVRLGGGFQPGVGSHYALLSYGSRMGTFLNTWPPLAVGAWDDEYDHPLHPSAFSVWVV